MILEISFLLLFFLLAVNSNDTTVGMLDYLLEKDKNFINMKMNNGQTALDLGSVYL